MTTPAATSAIAALEQLLADKEAELQKLKRTIILGETQWSVPSPMTDEQLQAVEDYFVHFAAEDDDEDKEESSIGSDYDEEAADAAYAAEREQEDQEKMMWMERRHIHAGHLLSFLQNKIEEAAERLTCGDVRFSHGRDERLQPDTALTFQVTRPNDKSATVNCAGGDSVFHLVELVCEAYIDPRWERFNDSGLVEDHVWYLCSGGGATGRTEEKDMILKMAMSVPSSLRKVAICWSFDFKCTAVAKEYVGPYGPTIRDHYHENDGHRVFISHDDSPRLLDCFVLRNGSTLTLEYDGAPFIITCIDDDDVDG